jgi:hypothetical protein
MFKSIVSQNAVPKITTA